MWTRLVNIVCETQDGDIPITFPAISVIRAEWGIGPVASMSKKNRSGFEMQLFSS